MATTPVNPQHGLSDADLEQKTLTLTSLAMLKVDIDDRRRDYVDYLAGFVLNLLTTRKPEVVTDAVVADALLQDFGLKVPIKAVQHVLRRMARNGHLRKEYQTFFPAPKLPRVDFTSKRADAETRIQRVYDALRGFAPSVQPTLEWGDSDAANAIIGFLKRFAVDCLRTYVFNTALPQVPATGPKELYIVSRFLQDAHENHRALFEDFIVLVKGQMYANALTCPDLQSLEQKFDRVTFYLDTPVVLNLLGLQGEGAKQAALELTTLVRDLNGTLAVFEHTLEEIKGVIRWAGDHFDDAKATTRILREMRNSGTGLSDLILCLDQLRERLSAHHIRIKPTPSYQTSSQIDEKAFQTALEDALRYPAEHTILHDINCVRCIYALRRDVEPSRLEDAVAVLVTSNTPFARKAFEFGKTHNSTKEVSPVITDYSLANVAWLKAPMKRPLLPEKETLALCFAALEPSGELFRKYVETMDRLRENGQISEEDHLILRLSPVAHRGLMNFTLGEEEALTGASLQQILERVKGTLVTEQKEQAAEDRKTYEEQLQQQQRMYRLSETEKARLRSEQTTLLLTASRRSRIIAKAGTITFMAAFSVALLLGAVGGAGLLATQNVHSAGLKALVWGCVVVAVCWGWYSWLTGKSVRALTEQIEDRVALRIFGWLTGMRDLP